jgi:hypothetical protein
MKEVKDMNLAEAITALRDVDVITRGWQCNYDAIEELTNRIDTLLFDTAQRHDAWVDALENKINSLEAERRWIPVEERLPTKEDADRYGYVLWWSEDEVALPVARYWYWDFTGVPKYQLTHWQRITQPEGV